MSVQSRGKLSHWLTKEDDYSGLFRLAKGIESLDNAKNPQTQEFTWIDDTSDDNTTGYRPSWAVSGYIYQGDKASEMLSEMAWSEAKNEDAEIYMVIVRGWVPGATSGTYDAKVYKCSWAPDNEAGGSGGENVTFSGSLNAKGDPVYGEFDAASNTFAAA